MPNGTEKNRRSKKFEKDNKWNFWAVPNINDLSSGTKDLQKSPNYEKMCINYLKAMNASPSSPPTIWTPPSGIESPAKNIRTSIAFADHGKFCRRMIQLIVVKECVLAAGNNNPKKRGVCNGIGGHVHSSKSICHTIYYFKFRCLQQNSLQNS